MSPASFLSPLPRLPPRRPRPSARRRPLLCHHRSRGDAPIPPPSAPADPDAPVVASPPPPTAPAPSRLLHQVRLPRPSPAPASPPALPSPLSALLPTAFPASVSPGYLAWALSLISRHVFRNAYYVLSTTSLLYSLGLGRTQALAVSAPLQWVLKDGLGLATKLLVSARLAPVVDADPKRWRVLGDSCMALASAIEIASLARPHYFLLFGAAAALVKDAASAMSGPSYRVFLDAFAVSANIGDVSSRGEVQVVVGNLLGLALGSSIAFLLGSLGPDHRLLPTLAVFAVLASGHLASTVAGVRAVQLRTLNWQRLQLVVHIFLTDGVVPDVAQVNKRETFLYLASPPPAVPVRLGVPLRDFVECGADAALPVARREDRCFVAYSRGEAGVVVREDARATDVLRAVLQARKLVESVDPCPGTVRPEEIARLTRDSYTWVEQVFPAFLMGLEKQGWSTAKLLVHLGEWRYREGTPLD